MQALDYIDKRKPSDDDSGFETLKNEGLQFIQALSGEIWTDYNAHDPGITILEQLIYGLTELNYQTSFEMEEYLTSPDGNLDYGNLALFKPDEIFPARALTINDYRKMIFNAVPEIDNVIIQPFQKGAVISLYKIDIALKEKNEGVWSEKEKKEIVEKVRYVYCENRNLCEDIADISVLENDFYTIHSSVESDNSRAPADILAEIYFRCSGFVASGISFEQYSDMKKNGTDLESIFSGPFTAYGYIRDDKLAVNRNIIRLSDITGLINSMDGVLSVTDIYFEKDGKKYYESVVTERSDAAMTLDFPDTVDDVHIRMFSGGRKYKTDYNELKNKYEKLNFEHRVLRHTPQNLDETFIMPQGRYRNYKEYYSIQNHFPTVYGTGRFGVPESYPESRKAKVRQLKGYLYFFEQIMANFLAMLENIPELFSIDSNLAETVSFYNLDNENIAGIEELYNIDDPKVMAGSFEKIVKKYDNFYDRRNRILDYLLSIYGEKCSQKSLQHFNYYYKDDAFKKELIDNKLRFLENMVTISRDKAASVNYMLSVWETDNLSGVELKTGLLLGLKDFRCRSLVASFNKDRIRLLTDRQYEEEKKKFSKTETKITFRAPESMIAESFYPVPYLPSQVENTDDDIALLVNKIGCLKHRCLSESLLRFGINTNRYRVGKVRNDKAWHVFFRPFDAEPWIYIAGYKDHASAVESVNRLQRFLCRLNITSEGFHLIEHVLLRPMGPEIKQAGDTETDFFGFRVSIVLPDWTARFNNKKFRSLCEETLCMNLPSHVYPHFIWLGLSEMSAFEELYKKWLALKYQNSNTKDLDVSAMAIRRFLEMHIDDAK